MKQRNKSAMGDRYARTDLAYEWGREAEDEEQGIRQTSERLPFGTQHTLHILDERAARHVGRPMGEYVTICCDPMWRLEPEAQEELESALALRLWGMLTEQTGKKNTEDLSVMVVGLGNRAITADAIGPLAVDALLVTRHLKDHEPELSRQLQKMFC